MPRCQASTRKGTRCKNNALEHTHHCRIHQPETVEAEIRDQEDDNPQIQKWRADQATVSAIGGATLGALVAGPLGAILGGAIGAYMGNYHDRDDRGHEEPDA